MNIYDLWFCSVNLSNRIKLKLMMSSSSFEEIWYFRNTKRNNIDFGEDYEKIRSRLNKAWNRKELEALLDTIKKKDFKSISFYDNSYPSKLKNIIDAPAVLFYKGNIERLNKGKNVAIIGSRNCSAYGREAASIISKELASYNIHVISGMARGIDTYAHKIALQNDGYTCAVLGSGIDVIYPKENKKLYEDIVQYGCVMSEFLPGTNPFSYNFPVRNRIISGLSDLIIIVEAAEKSGSLITAEAALEQGKDVFAIPGSIFSNLSKGTNTLIRDGAYPFTNFKDLFEILNIQYKINNKKKEAKTTEICGLQEKIYKIITDSPIHIDDIFKRTNIDIKQLYEVLFELQLEDAILCLPGNYYVKQYEKI